MIQKNFNFNPIFISETLVFFKLVKGNILNLFFLFIITNHVTKHFTAKLNKLHYHHDFHHLLNKNCVSSFAILKDGKNKPIFYAVSNF